MITLEELFDNYYKLVFVKNPRQFKNSKWILQRTMAFVRTDRNKKVEPSPMNKEEEEEDPTKKKKKKSYHVNKMDILFCTKIQTLEIWRENFQSYENQPVDYESSRKGNYNELTSYLLKMYCLQLGIKIRTSEDIKEEHINQLNSDIKQFIEQANKHIYKPIVSRKKNPPNSPQNSIKRKTSTKKNIENKIEVYQQVDNHDEDEEDETDRSHQLLSYQQNNEEKQLWLHTQHKPNSQAIPKFENFYREYERGIENNKNMGSNSFHSMTITKPQSSISNQGQSSSIYASRSNTSMFQQIDEEDLGINVHRENVPQNNFPVNQPNNNPEYQMSQVVNQHSQVSNQLFQLHHHYQGPQLQHGQQPFFQNEKQAQQKQGQSNMHSSINLDYFEKLAYLPATLAQRERSNQLEKWQMYRQTQQQPQQQQQQNLLLQQNQHQPQHQQYDPFSTIDIEYHNQFTPIHPHNKKIEEESNPQSSNQRGIAVGNNQVSQTNQSDNPQDSDFIFLGDQIYGTRDYYTYYKNQLQQSKNQQTQQSSSPQPENGLGQQQNTNGNIGRKDEGQQLPFPNPNGNQRGSLQPNFNYKFESVYNYQDLSEENDFDLESP